MIPQKSSNIPQWLAGIAVAIFAINNPDKAAELVNQVIHAITTFSAHLG
ncbi:MULTISPECIES: hypothetical protein [Actinomadura]|uniref:Uncharacterized protein n=1 Tax=Actinomadura nitritigenes TaxID=134602 RepID=A0ABS3QYJ6_9ACTN|nr:hypothetical protein [Actinomadura nitritigenes]MBO2438921.1 hypothetical protein [Actinomadura nitritigenes]HEU5026203.1 hypothetical protein [Spirillospora sp.]